MKDNKIFNLKYPGQLNISHNPTFIPLKNRLSVDRNYPTKIEKQYCHKYLKRQFKSSFLNIHKESAPICVRNLRHLRETNSDP